MGFYPFWPPLVGFFGLLLLAGTRLFSAADATASPSGAKRSRTIDGLRGFLALGVVFFHGAIYHRYIQDGTWTAPPSRFYVLLGTGGVAVFFMITGYLFWCRMIDLLGQPKWLPLYIGRLFRIGPLYLAAVLVMCAVLLSQDGWQLKVPPAAFLRELLPWLALGLLAPTDVNRHPATLILTAGVTWSLRYEWLFYVALPVLALAAGRGMGRACIVFAALGAGFFWTWRGGPHFFDPGDPAYMTLFLIGMACATADRNGWNAGMNPSFASIATVLLVMVVFLTCRIAYAPLAMALLGTCFYLVISGATLFGVLTHRASIRLGEISYGIYLLQGLVLAVLFQSAQVRHFALGSPLRHWSVVLGGTIVLVAVAFAGHVWVERPGISLGKRLARNVQLRRLTPAAPGRGG